MSTCQLKKTLISAEPRPVAERMVTTPGMSFMASSMGRVIVAIISSLGMTPLSTRMTTRGKLVCGKTEDGMVQAARMPPRHKQAVRKRMAFDCCTTRRLSQKPDDKVEGITLLAVVSRQSAVAVGRERPRQLPTAYCPLPTGFTA